MLSVVIPVKDGGDDLRRCLEAIAAQAVDDAVEVIVVDSGSRDGSAELAAAHGARVHRIAPHEFNHGATRNLGASLARGDVLVFTSQDAHAEDERWLARLVAPLAGPAIAGAYGRQVAHPDAKPPERFFLDFLYGPRPRLQHAGSAAELTMRTTLFSNVSAAIRRDVFERTGGFAGDVIMSEDQEWSRRVLLDGWTLAYVADAVVRHSHPYTVRDAFRRFFDSGASAERAYLAGARPAQDVLRREAVRYAREEVAWLVRGANARWLPYAGVYELAKFAGLQLGARHHVLPRAVKRRLSATPAFW